MKWQCFYFTSSAGVGIAVANFCGNSGSRTAFGSAENWGTMFSPSYTNTRRLLSSGNVDECETLFLNVTSDFKQLS
jgi:hypothetical protein